MSNDALAALALVAFFGGILALNLCDQWKAYGSLPTFYEYREHHLEPVNNGRCRCHQGSSAAR
jgi:hypothetical protein